MKNKMKTLFVGLCLGVMLTGCAIIKPVQHPAEPRLDAGVSEPRKRALLVTGLALVLAAVIVHEASDGANDALRDSVRP